MRENQLKVNNNKCDVSFNLESRIILKKYRRNKKYQRKIVGDKLNLTCLNKIIIIKILPANFQIMIGIFVLMNNIYLSINSKSKLIKLCDSTQITLIIKGKGTQKILGRDISGCDSYSGELPDHIYINGIHQNLTKVYEVSGLVNEENNITLEWNYLLTSCYCMLNCLKNVTKIDVSKLDTSKVETMYGMFSSCTSLKSLDLYNFNTSSVTDFNAMFYECHSLIYLKLNSFNTLRVTDFKRMFYNFYSLEIIDMENFQTSASSSKNNMFFNCSSLSLICLNKNKIDSTLINLVSNYQIDILK